ARTRVLAQVSRAPAASHSPEPPRCVLCSSSSRCVDDDQTRITNRITSALKNYFPQPVQRFADKDSHLLCGFIQQWPTLKAARQARRSTLDARRSSVSSTHTTSESRLS